MSSPPSNARYKWHARRGGSFLDFALDRPNRTAFNRLMREVKQRNQARRDAFAKLVVETRKQGRGYVANK